MLIFNFVLSRICSKRNTFLILIPLLFMVACGGKEVKQPSQESQLVLEAFDVDSDRSLMVGDSHNDIIGGLAAGCLTCAVTYGLGERSVLEETHPHMMIDRITDLQRLVR